MSKNHNQALRNHSISMVVLLVALYIIGTVVGLYVEFPEAGSAADNWKFAMQNGLVLSHILIGTLVVVGTIGLYVRALVLKDKNWKIAGGLAAGFSLLAWVSGEEFIAGQSDTYTVAMAVFFILALVALGWGIYQSKDQVAAKK
jgi:hypothetical protein